MKIVIADDDQIVRRILNATLRTWQHELITLKDGDEAWNFLKGVDAPCLAIVDWIMPGLDGTEVCRRVREQRPDEAIYLILLTAKTDKSHLVEGLAAGANDYIAKPFDEGELYARIRVGLRMLELQQKLADRIEELTQERAKVLELQKLIPICAYCKKIRDDQNYWQGLEHYLLEHAEIRFSHGICPCCMEKVLREIDPHQLAVG
jgi:DNA-binding response OmpR family regulator